MALDISVQLGNVHEKARKYRAEATEVDAVINRMNSILQELMADWEGDASRAYDARYQELKKHFEDARDLINEIADAVDKVADTYKRQMRV
ncbi:MAG: WXG100 family type VII secretion target [Coriobacteriia bacterium]|nr:WXG100 family type VII secretion target [Coriobacteriia bacterium]